MTTPPSPIPERRGAFPGLTIAAWVAAVFGTTIQSWRYEIERHPGLGAAAHFEQFFTTKPVGKGTGQGLALSHRIVTQKHGGQLTFDRVPGKGTTFRVTLPTGSSAASADPAQSATPGELPHPAVAKLLPMGVP